jgi:signal transduction histidine kinase
MSKFDSDQAPGAVEVTPDSGSGAPDLRAQIGQLKEQNAQLERFAAAAAHELAEPLRVIAGYASLMLGEVEGPLSPQQADYLRRISRGVDRMQLLLDDMRRRTSARAAPNFDEVDLALVLASALEDLGPAMAEHGARVEVTTALPIVWGDRVQLGQLVENLLANAVKYGPPSDGVVTIGAHRVEDGWRVDLSDRGIGIAAADQARIFEPFTRVRVEGVSRGSGLGLAICNEIVVAHGGLLTVDSEVGRGATFSFTLPSPPRA